MLESVAVAITPSVAVVRIGFQPFPLAAILSPRAGRGTHELPPDAGPALVAYGMRLMTPVHAPRRLVIATRESALALWQAGHVRAMLARLYPHASVELLGLTTQGDRIVDLPLAAIGGKGLFVKELELAMSEGRADLAVHSLKDVPMELPDGFTLAAIGAREDPRDALVSNRFLDLAALPGGARI